MGEKARATGTERLSDPVRNSGGGGVTAEDRKIGGKACVNSGTVFCVLCA